MWKKGLLALCLIGYMVALIGVLLVVRFPKERFLVYVATQVERLLPAGRCAIADVSYTYPATLTFHRISITDGPLGAGLDIDTAEFRFAVRWPLRRAAVRFLLHGTEVTADVHIDHDQSLLDVSSLSVQNVDLERWGGLQQQLDRHFDGVAGFVGTYQAPLKRPVDGALNGTVHIDQLRLPLRRPILQQEELHFDTVTVVLRATDGAIELVDGTASGIDFQSRFVGTIRLAGSWWQSMVDLGIEFNPSPELLNTNLQLARAVALLHSTYGPGPIPATVSGTLVEPMFDFGAAQRP